MVISRRCFEENDKEMYQRLQRPCKASVLLIKSIFFSDVLVVSLVENAFTGDFILRLKAAKVEIRY